MLTGDTGDPADVDRLAGETVERLGRIDIWVNNAGRLMVKPLLETTDEDWHGLLRAESSRLLPRLQGGGANNGGAGAWRPDRQRQLRGGRPAAGRSDGLHHRQERHRGPDKDARARARAARDHRQRTRPRRHRDAAQPARLHAGGERRVRASNRTRPHRGTRARSPMRPSFSRRTRPATSPDTSCSSTAGSSSTAPSGMRGIDVRTIRNDRIGASTRSRSRPSGRRSTSGSTAASTCGSTPAAGSTSAPPGSAGSRSPGSHPSARAAATPTTWRDSWGGGLVTTCGLDNVGAPAEGVGLHGTYTFLEAADLERRAERLRGDVQRDDRRSSRTACRADDPDADR